VLYLNELNRGGVMAKKEGINTLQRLMNVVFIVWALWFCIVILNTKPLSALFKLTWRDFENGGLSFFITFFGWLFILVLNYILNNKATVWNKGS
jgi:hypothetical protein